MRGPANALDRSALGWGSRRRTGAILQRVGKRGEHAKLHGLVVAGHRHHGAGGDVDVVHLGWGIGGCEDRSTGLWGWVNLGVGFTCVGQDEGLGGGWKMGEMVWRRSLQFKAQWRRVRARLRHGHGWQVAEASQRHRHGRLTSMSDTAVRSLQHQLTRRLSLRERAPSTGGVCRRRGRLQQRPTRVDRSGASAERGYRTNIKQTQPCKQPRPADKALPVQKPAGAARTAHRRTQPAKVRNQQQRRLAAAHR